MMLEHTYSRPERHARRYLSVVLALGALGLLLTACSSGGSATTTTTTSAGKTTGGASLSAYRQCLSKHGVTLPNFSGRGTPPSGAGGAPEGGTPPSGTGGPPGGGGFSNNPKFAAAAKACASVEPKGGFGGFGGGANGANSTAFAAYRNCLKLHGVTLPSGTSGSPTSTVDTSSAAYQAAQTACASLRPSAGSTPSSTASPGTS
jgi:hypothetical protein